MFRIFWFIGALFFLGSCFIVFVRELCLWYLLPVFAMWICGILCYVLACVFELKNKTKPSPKRTYPEIPKGIYCYTHHKGRRIVCPYWRKIEGGAYCELLKATSTNYETNSLIWDQVKECRINEDIEKE